MYIWFLTVLINIRDMRNMEKLNYYCTRKNPVNNEKQF